MKVSFLVAGTQKGGTSALDNYMRQHPQLKMAKNKEVHFFDCDKLFSQSQVDYTIYHSNFNSYGIASLPLYGEVTPIYMYWYRVPERVWNYNKKIKWILILRNPIERAFSHWNMERDRGREKLSFFDAIREERNRSRETLPYQDRKFSYVDRGFYVEQIRRIWHYFSVEQTLILKTEELRNDSQYVLKKITEFLEIDSYVLSEFKVVHARKYFAKLSKIEKAHLLNIYEYEIKQLERILGWDCRSWIEI
jgi:hypothetical protein